ncbi:MAG: serine/threonine protein kinase/tetratricopeptide (TPR) repeat protein [Cyclobacteriaceae bacterium]|jgi:serine/threonine protein kinase/tetratricopeptide (TPR) repeat protein
MTRQFIEGEDFAGFTFLQPLFSDEDMVTWLAMDQANHERVCLKVFMRPLNVEQRTSLTEAIDRQRGLIHPHILRTSRLLQTEGQDLLVTQYVKGSQPLSLTGSIRDQWRHIEKLLDILDYVHRLDAAHGHLQARNLLQDEQQNVYLSDFGLPLPVSGTLSAMLSPQVNAGQTVDASDDIYSLGQILFTMLTGHPWSAGQRIESSVPMVDEAHQLIMAMLAESAFDRPRHLSTIRDVLSTHYGPLSDSEPATGKLSTDKLSTDKLSPGESSNTKPTALAATALAATAFSRQAPAGSQEPALDTTTPPPRLRKLPAGQPVMSTAQFLIALSCLLALVIGVFFFLPAATTLQPPQVSTAAKNTPQIDTPAAANQALAPLEIARQERMLAQAKETASELLRAQIGLEDQGAQIWATTAYEDIVQQGIAADEFYRQGDYAFALDQYQSAIDASSTLLASITDVRATNEAIAAQALQNGDSAEALAALKILKAIDPSDAGLQKQIRRAENLDQVIELVANARQQENDQALLQAKNLYQQALDLDAAWSPASEGLKRVKAGLLQQRFNSTMSRGFASLEAGEIEQAREAFNAAKKIMPDSSAPADGLTQLTTVSQGQEISSLKESAELAVDTEDWPAAIAQFEQLLSVDPTLIFARKGLEQARQRQTLDEAITRHLANPGLMREDDELNSANQSLITTSRIKHRGPRLQQQYSDLSQLTSLARIPIPVVLTSDNVTSVTVYKVGELGPLERHELSLFPGTYTIVGKRSGYRDVQRRLTLAGGNSPQEIYISCDEKI